MKNWVILGLAAVVCYWMYSSWFASDDGGDEADKPVAPLVVEEPKKPAPAGAQKEAAEPAREEHTGATAATKAPVRLDLGAGGTDGAAPKPNAESDAAWALHLQRVQALKDGQDAAVKNLTALILRNHPKSDAARWIHFERGRVALAAYRAEQGSKRGLVKAHEARKELTPALFLTRADPAEREALRTILQELAQVVLFAGRHVEGSDFTYMPKRGDNLSTLCRKVFPKRGAFVSPGFVADVNGLPNPRALRAREPIRVPTGRPEIVVVKSEYRLYYLFDGAYVRDFPVGLGKDGSTPVATFKINNKQKKPDWYPRAGVRIKYGDPRNILGTRWLGFAATETYRGFGIHGTTEPGSIGKQASSGCVRMLRADVERVYDWTPEGTLVRVMK